MRPSAAVTRPAPRPAPPPALAGDVLADPCPLLARVSEGPGGRVRRSRRNDHHVADAHVEGPEHLGILHAAGFAQRLEHGGRRPRAPHEPRAAALREHARHIARAAPPRYLRHPPHFDPPPPPL